MRIDFPSTEFDAAGVAIPGTGYNPEGIAVSGDTFYAGSTQTGEIIKGNLRTGEYQRNWVPASPSQPSELHRGILGLLVDGHNRLWAASSVGLACNGTTTPCPPGVTPPVVNYGAAFVYDATTGAQLAQYTLTSANSKTINDMTISGDAVYFSNTTAPSGAGSEVQFKLQLGPGGALPPGDVPATAPRSPANPAVTNIPTPGFTSADGIDTLPNGNLILNSVGRRQQRPDDRDQHDDAGGHAGHGRCRADVHRGPMRARRSSAVTASRSTGTRSTTRRTAPTRRRLRAPSRR